MCLHQVRPDGTTRPELLEPFAAGKTFIYVLETLAQVLLLVTFARRWIGASRHTGHQRAPPEAKVSDAISKTDDFHTRAEGWTTVHAPSTRS